MKRFILKHALFFTVLIGIFAGLLTLLICNAQDNDFSRYGLLDYKSGLQKVYNLFDASGIKVVGYYPFDPASGNIPDYSPYANHLTKHGSPTYLQPDFLGLSRAITFAAGNVDYYDHSDSDDFELYISGQKIDAFFIVVFKTSFDSTEVLISKRVAAAEGYYLAKHDNDKLDAFIQDNASHYAQIQGTTVVNDGNWHVALWYVNWSDNKMAVGADGAINAVPADISSIGDSSNSQLFTVGKNSANNSNLFTGSIAGIIVAKGNPTLPSYMFTAEFFQFVYKTIMGWPKILPREME